jgi:hypothetical protein
MQTGVKIPDRTRTTTVPAAPVDEAVRVSERTEEHVTAGPSRRRPSSWVIASVVFVTLIGLASAIFVITRTADAPEVVAATVTGPAVGSQEFLYKLAEQGYIPMESVDTQRLLLERLVASGDIPAASLEPSRALMESVYTPYELLLLEAVESGHIPAETLDTDTFRDKELIVRRGGTIEDLP